MTVTHWKLGLNDVFSNTGTAAAAPNHSRRPFDVSWGRTPANSRSTFKKYTTWSSKCKARTETTPRRRAAGWPSAPSSCWPSPPSVTTRTIATIARKRLRSRRIRDSRRGTTPPPLHTTTPSTSRRTQPTAKTARSSRKRRRRRRGRRGEAAAASPAVELSDMSSKPAAYPGGQSLPPWPYPEAKPAARPTPASYDPACILKVSWPRDAARPTEDTLRETFPSARARAQRRPRQRQRRDGGLQGRRRRARRRGRLRRPWRTAPAKPPRPPLISRRRRPRRARCDSLPQELAGLAPGASPRCIGRSRPLCIATVHRSQSQFAIRPPPSFVASRTGGWHIPPCLSYCCFEHPDRRERLPRA